MVVLSQI